MGFASGGGGRFADDGLHAADDEDDLMGMSPENVSVMHSAGRSGMGFSDYMQQQQQRQQQQVGAFSGGGTTIAAAAGSGASTTATDSCGDACAVIAKAFVQRWPRRSCCDRGSDGDGDGASCVGVDAAGVQLLGLNHAAALAHACRMHTDDDEYM
eukprot:148403-Chlamydomonas_euryale.AAC.1